jgi:methyltransferase (TIGR00027 family)
MISKSVIKHRSVNHLWRKTMEPNQAGITAMITAYSRAYHATHDSPIIFNDFLADQLFTAQERSFFDMQLSTLLGLIDPDLASQNQDQASALALVMQLQTGPITLSRSRYCEEELERAIQNGVEQYVILGAGFDTFAFRHPELADRLQVFEVDHPVTQSMKQQRIAAANWQMPENMHLVPVDFAKDRLMDALIGSGFDPAKKSFFSWLGVTYYLSMQSISDTFTSIASCTASGSMIVFDYIDAEGFIAEKACRAVQLMQNIARQAGEPMLASFEPDKLNLFLNENGFALVENLLPAVIEERYFQNRQDCYHAFENVHIARAMIK